MLRGKAISTLLFISLAAATLTATLAVRENPCPSDDPPESAYDCCHADKDAPIQDCPSPWSCMKQADDPPPCVDGFVLSSDGSACVRSCNASDYSCMCLPMPGSCYNNSQVPPVGAGGAACCQGSNITLDNLPHPEFWTQYDDDEPGVGQCTLAIDECNYAGISDKFCCFDEDSDGTTYPSNYKAWGHGESVTGGVNYHGAQSMLICDENSSYDQSKGVCYNSVTGKHSPPLDSLCFKSN